MNLKSKNPFLSNKSFAQTTTVHDEDGRPVQVIDYNNIMTVNGAINKAILLFVILLASAFFGGYLMLFQGVHPMVLTLGGGLTGLALVLIAAFRPQYSGVLAPGYSIFKGLFVGGISVVMELMYPGIVLQAVGATLVTFMICFLLYRFRIVKVTQQFRAVVVASTLAILSYYLLSWVLSLFFNFNPVGTSVEDNSLMSIGISVFVIVIASLNLFLDFDMIEQGAERRLPKYMEWFGAMGLIITLVWLYVEFLRLLAKISSRD